MKDITKHIISDQRKVRDALEDIENIPTRTSKTLFVTENDKLVGTLTDGDIRRSLIQGIDLDHPVRDIMFTKFRYMHVDKVDPLELRKIREAEIRLLPIVDSDMRIIRIVDLWKKKSILPVDAIIMAGGIGKRLGTLTEDTPKPLLKIGDKPIIEYTIDHLIKYGVENIHVSINYKGEQIEAFLGDGSDKSVNISYIREDQPLGTMGAVSLVSEYKNDYLLVINADLLSDIDFEGLFLDCIKKDADMAVASVSHEQKIPYATLEIDGDEVKSFREKPTYTYFLNAGIYLFKKEIAALIPHNEVFNATDLMEKVVAEKRKLICYPILGYWLDIGKPEDFEKAQQDIKHLKLS